MMPPGNTLAVDPGLNGCGVAVFSPEGILLRALYVRNPAHKSDGLGRRVKAMGSAVRGYMLHEVTSLVVEWPRFYPGGRTVTGHALLSLAGVDGAILAAFNGHAVRTVEPPEWKGSLDPAAMIERIRHRLSAEERLRVCVLPTACPACSSTTPPFEDCRTSSCLAHNVFDAIGIGLWDAGRLRARKAVAR